MSNVTILKGDGYVRVANSGPSLVVASLPGFGAPCHVESGRELVIQTDEAEKVTVMEAKQCPTCGLTSEVTEVTDDETRTM